MYNGLVNHMFIIRKKKNEYSVSFINNGSLKIQVNLISSPGKFLRNKFTLIMILTKIHSLH